MRPCRLAGWMGLLSIACAGADDEGGTDNDNGGEAIVETGDDDSAPSGSSSDQTASEATVFSSCVARCERMNTGCPGSNQDCTSRCEDRAADTPEGCAELSISYNLCLAATVPDCDNLDWAAGAEEVCDSGPYLRCLAAGGLPCGNVTQQSSSDFCALGGLPPNAVVCQEGATLPENCEPHPKDADIGYLCCPDPLP